MQAGNVIEVTNITKNFKVYYDRGSSFKEFILRRGNGRYQKREVLKGISFSVKKGEAIGLIGKNGCGKSTTLKLLSKIIYPDSGKIEMSGRVSSLLELGAGFHPDMSGRENIYLNASIFGLTRKEIDEKIDDIIKFSELEEFIENPVRTYSSGMYMRLAFSVAISVEADILLIDEILAVGDVSFQTKCFQKLKEIKAAGATIIIVSHSMGQIEQICDRCIWLEDGLIKEEGIPRFVDEKYLASMETKRLDKVVKEVEEKRQKKEGKKEIAKESKAKENVEEKKEKILMPTNWSERAIRSGSGEIRFTKVELQNEDFKESMVYKTGEKMVVHMEYASECEGMECFFAVAFCRDDGVYCYGTNTTVELDEYIKCSTKGIITMEIPELLLLPAKYFVDIAIRTKDKLAIDRVHHVLEFEVLDEKKDFGVMRMRTEWKVKRG